MASGEGTAHPVEKLTVDAAKARPSSEDLPEDLVKTRAAAAAIERLAASLAGSPAVLRTVMLAEDEWAVLQEVRLTALKEDPDSFLSNYARESQYGEREWRAEFARGEWAVTVGKGRVIGLLGATRESSTPRTQCYLEYMWVFPESRRQGVASALVGAMIDRLASSGITTILLWVLEGNEPALRLYRKFGFTHTGKKQPLESEPTRSEELMSLAVS